MGEVWVKDKDEGNLKACPKNMMRHTHIHTHTWSKQGLTHQDCALAVAHEVKDVEGQCMACEGHP